jgi:hypothetical protein
MELPSIFPKPNPLKIKIKPLKFKMWCGLPKDGSYTDIQERTPKGVDKMLITETYSEVDLIACGLPLEEEPVMLNKLIKGVPPVKSVQIRRESGRYLCKYTPHTYNLGIITKNKFVVYKDEGAYLVDQVEVVKYLDDHNIKYFTSYHNTLKFRILFPDEEFINDVLKKHQQSIQSLS